MFPVSKLTNLTACALFCCRRVIKFKVSMNGRYTVHAMVEVAGSVVDIDSLGDLTAVASDGGIDAFDTSTVPPKPLDVPGVPLNQGLVSEIKIISLKDHPDVGLAYGTTSGYIGFWKLEGKRLFGMHNVRLLSNPGGPGDQRGELGDITCLRWHRLSGHLVATSLAGHLICFEVLAGFDVNLKWSQHLPNKSTMTVEFSDETSLSPDVHVYTLQEKRYIFNLADGTLKSGQKNVGIPVATSMVEAGTLYLGNPLDGVQVLSNKDLKVIRNIKVVQHHKDYRACRLAVLDGALAAGSDSGVRMFDCQSGEMLDILQHGKPGVWVQTTAVVNVQGTKMIATARSEKRRTSTNIVYFWKANPKKAVNGGFLPKIPPQLWVYSTLLFMGWFGPYLLGKWTEEGRALHGVYVLGMVLWAFLGTLWVRVAELFVGVKESVAGRKVVDYFGL